MAGLPADDTPWPPVQEAPRYDRMRVYSLWYAGNPDELSAFYSGGSGAETVQVVEDGVARRVLNAIRRFFWGVNSSSDVRSGKVHVDLARDIAVMSSEALFSEGLKVRVDGPVEEEDIYEEQIDPDGKPDPITGAPPALKKVLVRAKGEPTEATAKTQERLDELLDRMNFKSLMLQAAETQSPLGSVGLRVAWDKTIDPQGPFLAKVDADNVITEYRWGRLVAVTFWRLIEQKGHVYVRHLERHEHGFIYHAVYKGGLSNLGKRQPLELYPQMEGIREGLNDDGAIEMPEEYRFATSIPNALPDPLDRSNAAGRSDYTPAVLSAFDSVDEIATSLMRDIELGKGRLIVADYMLEDGGAGKGSSFNPESKIFSPLHMQPTDDREAPITLVQFKIRVDEHIRAIEWFANKALHSAGFSTETETGSDARDITATEFTGRGQRTKATRDKKIAYWMSELGNILEALLAADQKEFLTPIQVFPVVVEFAEDSQPNQRVLAETVEFMKRAEAASLQVRVETLHPDWDVRQVQDEVERIQEESSSISPDMLGLSTNPPLVDPSLENPSAEPQDPEGNPLIGA